MYCDTIFFNESIAIYWNIDIITQPYENVNEGFNFLKKKNDKKSLFIYIKFPYFVGIIFECDF